jgi:hypothetical protein
MAVKQTGRKIYKSMQGKQVDMDLLRQKNELTPAVGNARVNARGDELGPGGKIIKKREDVLADFYRDNPQNTVQDEAPVRKEAQPVAEEVAPKGKDLTDDWVEPEDGEWVEDPETGDFVQKGK